jgi:hypothetical protein
VPEGTRNFKISDLGLRIVDLKAKNQETKGSGSRQQ